MGIFKKIYTFYGNKVLIVKRILGFCTTQFYLKIIPNEWNKHICENV